MACMAFVHSSVALIPSNLYATALTPKLNKPMANSSDGSGTADLHN